jgi:hypothetical protein
MKAWPKDKTKTVNFEDLIDPLLELYRQVMENPKGDFKYKGYNIGSRELACCMGVDDYTLFEGREYHHERDRDDHYIFLMLAFQLGVEQGRRDLLDKAKLILDKKQLELF